ncbi:hypothetical protein O3G_MSEX012428 [Manduca sexta]|uniref:Uncharacterized protein n=1 Tax=Manduca sexta TaxID=7130 RepID=A0A922CWP4_MANSE|nr:hypothetical protein O3G_MSEX012428 [Manduca sexta]
MSGGRRSNAAGPYAFYVLTQSSIVLRINEFTPEYEGVYQAVFGTQGGNVTKTILELKDPSQKDDEAPAGINDTPRCYAVDINVSCLPRWRHDGRFVVGFESRIESDINNILNQK